MGCCCVFDQGVVRLVGLNSVPEFDGFLQTRAAQHYLSKKQLVSTRRLDEAEIAGRYGSALQGIRALRPPSAIFEHERIDFASYPQEWPPEMLWAAGRLTLDIGHAVLAENYGLKDATPCNILFRGSQPVFIDALSFERRQPGDPAWKPCAQFIRSFLLPLLANRRRGLALADIFATTATAWSRRKFTACADLWSGSIRQYYHWSPSRPGFRARPTRTTNPYTRRGCFRTPTRPVTSSNRSLSEWDARWNACVRRP